jgi:ATP-dependent helicase HrpB
MEPRRVAAISAAARVAELWGKKLGSDVGYRVRGDSRSGARTRVEFVTPGILLRLIQDDPGLEGYACVILDEFHERSAQADLAFALLAQSREMRSGLALLTMSATMDLAKAQLALSAPVLEVPGRAYPITTRYSSVPEGSLFEDDIAGLALSLMDETEGDLLVFLPGAAEIGRAQAAFQSRCRGAGSQFDAVSLHGSLPLDVQKRILSPAQGAPRRAIFSTSIAETSLTVPRVRAVLDSGLARLSRFQSRTGLNRLVTEREAKDRADQRRGRSGRLGPGVCLRAWSESEILPERTEPELLRAELSSMVLEAALWGSPRRLDLGWLDPPPEAAWAAGTELLLELGALSSDLSPTAFGRRMAALGTEPRLAALVLRGEESGELWTACVAAALLSERGLSEHGAASDIALRMEDLGGDAAPILAEATRLAAAAGGAKGSRTRPEALGPLLAAAFPDRIGERADFQGDRASFRIPAGRMLKARGELARSPWIVALDADSGISAEGRIYSAYALGETEARAALEAQAVEDVEIEWRGLELKATKVRRAGAIILARRQAESPSREALCSLLGSRVAAEGLSILPWDEGGGSELARLRCFAAKLGEESRRAGLDPASLGDEALASSLEAWLGPYIAAEGGPVIDGPALARAVAALVPRELKSRLDKEAPFRLELPSGSSRRIEYRGPLAPFVEAKAQEFFGLDRQPLVCGSPLVLKLLDPGGKPLQVTSDLPGFWRGSWKEARKDLKGHYPKHEWPEDPSQAAPSRSGVKRRKA